MNHLRHHQLKPKFQKVTQKFSIFLHILSKLLKGTQNIIDILIKETPILWSLNLINSRLRYKFDALYWGIKSNKLSKSNCHNFRRNIHRLEKGLSYPISKNVFAEDYILETVLFLKEDLKNPTFDGNTKNWGVAVLNLYFMVCSHSTKISEAHKLFQELYLNNQDDDWIPYLSSDRAKLLIDSTELYQLALRRRSIRYYLDKPVELSLIEEAMRIASLSPSACNRQSFKFLFFNQKTLVEKISQIPGGVSGYKVPNIIVVIGCYSGYFDTRDINAPIIDASLASMTFVLALETLGLSSVCINWPNLPDREEKIRELIHLNKDEFIIMLIGLGYPDPVGKVPFSAKKKLDEILCINQRIKRC